MAKISVIICAYNRCDSVKALLECFLIQEADDDCLHEVIVVDNNSMDKTREAVESYVPKFKGRLRYLFEPRQGKPFALNLGIEKSRGDVLAFTDDDCLVEKDYMAQVNIFFQEHTDIDFMGGKILPRWEGGDCPAWLNEELSNKTEYDLGDERFWRRIFFRGPLGILDYGEKPFRVDSSQKRYRSFLFYGPNMAVKKNVFDKIGGYATDRVITQDTEICLRLVRAGMKGLYAPNVAVSHRIPVAKATPEFYYHWYFRRGHFLELDNVARRKFYHPLGIQNEFIVKTCQLFIKSITAPSVKDKVHFRSQAFFNLAQMGKIAKRNII